MRAAVTQSEQQSAVVSFSVTRSLAETPRQAGGAAASGSKKKEPKSKKAKAAAAAAAAAAALEATKAEKEAGATAAKKRKADKDAGGGVGGKRTGSTVDRLYGYGTRTSNAFLHDKRTTIDVKHTRSVV